MRAILTIITLSALAACGQAGAPDTANSLPAAAPVEVVPQSAAVLDAQAAVARQMVTAETPGTPVMPSGLAKLDPSDYSRELTRFIPLEIGMDRFAAIDELRLYYNSSASVASKISSTEQRVNDDVITVFRRSGLADDSVAAEETFARFSGDKLADFGTRIQCYRGNAPNEWTTDLCP